MNVTRWEDATWILHDLTVPLDEAAAEDGPRERRRWRAVSSVNFEVALRESRWPPNSRYLISQNWPDICVEEGVFDGESLSALLELLTELSGPDAACFAFYGQVPANNYDDPTVLEGPLSAIPDLTRDPDFRELTPSNWWPTDPFVVRVDRLRSHCHKGQRTALTDRSRPSASRVGDRRMAATRRW